MLSVIGLVVAALAALLHVYIWVMESITWRRPGTWRRFAVRDQDAADVVQPMAFNQGFYNLFLAVLAGLGVVLVAVGTDVVGRTLAYAGLGSMLGAAVVLAACGRKYHRPAVLQGALPLIALVLLLA